MNLPNTFEEKMKHLLGEEYEDYLKCYEEPRHYGLRVNTNKISVEDFLKIAPWPEMIPRFSFKYMIVRSLSTKCSMLHSFSHI